MLYRELGKTGEKVSILGLDVTKLPVLDNDSRDEIIMYAIDNGINYIDTAYTYQDNEYESYLGDFFNKNPEYREKVLISTKMPSWLINSKDDLDAYFEKQTANLKFDFVDFYLLDYVKPDVWKKLVKYGVLEFLDKLKAEGKAKYVGFSFYGELELFFEVADAYDWDVTQIPFNFMDINNHAGFESIRHANGENMGVIIRDPLRRGCLTDNIPSEVQEVWDFADEIKTPTEWCLKFVWDYDEVDTILTDINNLDQLKEIIEYADNATPGCMSRNDKDIIKEVRFTYRGRIPVRCDKCTHCLPCDEGVNIPKNFEVLNNVYVFGDDTDENSSNMKYAHDLYYFEISEEERASNCNACGECEKICAQFINIADRLSELEELFED